ncbi:MAG TPA: helix-turn-helix domain-containing protein [Candidatus Paceibacterota bacterium]
MDDRVGNMNEARELAGIFNISLNEAKVYLALNSNGPSMVSAIAKVADLPRTAVYPPLENMVKKGFVGVTNYGNRKYYSAIAPEQLTTLLAQKQSSLETLVNTISKQEKISSPENKLEIVYYPGRNGIKTAGQIFLDETREKMWYSFENPTDIVELVGVDFEKSYVDERAKRGIKSRMILSAQVATGWMREFLDKDKEQLRETIMVNPREYPFDSTIAATKGLTILINGSNSPFAVLIRNDNLARNLISVHKLVWSRYRE